MTEFFKSNSVNPEPNHFHWMGTYYLRTGDLPNARLYFNKSLALSNARQNSFYASDTRFSLALVCMAEGNPNEALTEIQEAARLDSRVFNRLNINLNDAWYARIKSLYQPKFENSLFAVWDQLNAMNNQKAPQKGQKNSTGKTPQAQ